MTTTTPATPSEAVLTKKDFASNQDVRWCPGCGDYAILKAVQGLMPDLGLPREDIVFISGIGCSSRFPYYMNTYGFHTIHGRAPAIASGLKIARPDLSVWVVTGDGDGLSIGGNHLLHALRRNMNINILLFNNQIYGLTKGQYSPTSEIGKKTKSTPEGSVDRPVNPLSFALGANATFIGRGVDVEIKELQALMKQAYDHQGGSFVEILQNCHVFNDGAFSSVTNRATKSDNQLKLTHGEPLLFGDNKGITISNDCMPHIVDVGDGANQTPLKDIVVHNEQGNATYAFMLSQMRHPDFPVPLGVLHRQDIPSYDALIQEKSHAQRDVDLQKLFTSGSTWTVS